MIKLENYSDYEIYPELGKVWSIKSNNWIGAKQAKGYWRVTLHDDDGKQKNFQLHRLIWESVNGTIPEGLQVNHIDEDKSNNSITNLNLMTPKQNSNWGTGIERSAEKRTNGVTSKQVAAYKDGVLVMAFPSTKEAQRNGFSSGHISQCCNGKLSHYKSYTWRYLS